MSTVPWSRVAVAAPRRRRHGHGDRWTRSTVVARYPSQNKPHSCEQLNFGITHAGTQHLVGAWRRRGRRTRPRAAARRLSSPAAAAGGRASAGAATRAACRGWRSSRTSPRAPRPSRRTSPSGCATTAATATAAARPRRPPRCAASGSGAAGSAVSAGVSARRRGGGGRSAAGGGRGRARRSGREKRGRGAGRCARGAACGWVLTFRCLSMSAILRSGRAAIACRIAGAVGTIPLRASSSHAASNSWCAAGVQKKELERRMPTLDATRRIGPPDGASTSGTPSASIECGAEHVRRMPPTLLCCCDRVRAIARSCVPNETPPPSPPSASISRLSTIGMGAMSEDDAATGGSSPPDIRSGR